MKTICIKILAAASIVCGLLACSRHDPLKEVQPEWGSAADFAQSAAAEAVEFSDAVGEIGLPDLGKYDIPAGPRSCARLRLNMIGRLDEIFNDSNKYQYAVAERLGITPISGIGDAFYTKRPIVKIESNPLYEVDELTHSMPYLVPEAATLLATIGRNFIDSLGSRGADGYRIIVTSVLRTPQTVKSLRRVNRNATDSSTHKFGTTFDITYSRFQCADSSRTVHDGDLKNLLAEVLLDLHRQGRCLVKFERKSPCFHITATGK